MPILPMWHARVPAVVAAAFMGAWLTGGAQQTTVRPRPFLGGIFEASGVAHVPGTNGVLFVDDNRSRAIFFMEIGPDGAQRAPVTAVAMPGEIEDPEGIATDGTWFYVVGSQSKGSGPDAAGLARFRFDAKARRIEQWATIDRLKAWLVEHVPALEGIDPSRADEDGFNIEGLGWDPARARLLLGFRAPVADGRALIVAIKLADPNGALSRENLTVDGNALGAPLGGAGVRSLEYDPASNATLILAGPSGSSGSAAAFRLVEWREGAADIRTIATFDESLQPEGVARLSGPEAAGTLVVFDTSRYVLIR